MKSPSRLTVVVKSRGGRAAFLPRVRAMVDQSARRNCGARSSEVAVNFSQERKTVTPFRHAYGVNGEMGGDGGGGGGGEEGRSRFH